jgi:hypothetical protein
MIVVDNIIDEGAIFGREEDAHTPWLPSSSPARATSFSCFHSSSRSSFSGAVVASNNNKAFIRKWVRW